jgi:hypothetical protein
MLDARWVWVGEGGEEEGVGTCSSRVFGGLKRCEEKEVVVGKAYRTMTYRSNLRRHYIVENEVVSTIYLPL